MPPRSRLDEMLSGTKKGAPLIDIGTTSLTGIQAGAVPRLQKNNALAHPVFQTIPLDARDSIRLGSDFMRSGLLYDVQVLKDERFMDAFGVEWLRDEDHLVPISHPLETAGLMDIARYPKPQWLQPVQQANPELSSNSIVIADTPCPGLLDMCFMLRNTWQFMEDIVTNWRIASALLEWSLEAIITSYEYMLTSLDKQPDVIVYSDDLGYQDSMFFSPLDFRKYVLPTLRMLLTHLRNLTPAAICFHSCGAISPLLTDIADLNIEILNLDTHAKGLDVRRLRKQLPGSLVLHGSNDLCALGKAVANRDKARIASLITELAQSAPVIAGPMDNMSFAEEVLETVRGAAFIRNISEDAFENLRCLGPIRSVIEEAIEKTLSTELPAL